MIPNHPDPKAIRQAILEGDTQAATEYAQAAQGAGLPAVQAVEPFIAAIRHAGELFEQGDFFLPQLLLASKAMKAALAVLFPSSDESDAQSALSHGTVVAGTVQGDIHEIGKNLVCALLSAHGFKVIDLGGDVSPERFMEQIQQSQANLLALSALLTTTMIQQKNLIEKLTAGGLRTRIKVMVGGAPVTADWAKSIGADGYAPDAARAVEEALRLLKKSDA